MAAHLLLLHLRCAASHFLGNFSGAFTTRLNDFSLILFKPFARFFCFFLFFFARLVLSLLVFNLKLQVCFFAICARRLWPHEVLAHLANFLALELPAHAFCDAPVIVDLDGAAFVVWAIGLYRNPAVVLRKLGGIVHCHLMLRLQLFLVKVIHVLLPIKNPPFRRVV